MKLEFGQREWNLCEGKEIMKHKQEQLHAVNGAVKMPQNPKEEIVRCGMDRQGSL